jgi:hypothetical protein
MQLDETRSVKWRVRRFGTPDVTADIQPHTSICFLIHPMFLFYTAVEGKGKVVSGF